MPGNGPTTLNDLVIRRLCDALKRGNNRRNACALSGIALPTFNDWLRKAKDGAADYEEFGRRIRAAEADAEDGAVEHIKAGKPGWQGVAWWIQRRTRPRWCDPVAPARGAPSGNAANDTDLSSLRLEDLESAIQDAAELKRKALAEAGKKGTG
jgi:hypothetical protein